MNPHVLCIGGDDHRLRIPFLLALRSRGYRVSAAGTADPAPFQAAEIPYHLLQFGRFLSPLADMQALRAIPKLIRDLQPAIVQCFDTKAYLLVPLAAGRLRGVRIVSTVNGIGLLYCLRSPLALAARPVYERLQRVASRATAVTVFQNGHDRDFFAQKRMQALGRTLVIPGSGVDVAAFERARSAGPGRDALRSELGLGNAEVVITVTRMTRQKGIPTLLEAAETIHRTRPGVRFLLVGPSEEEGRFAVPRAEIERHAPYVKAIGPRFDVPALLAMADLFAFPSEYPEGIPRVLLEAALAGLPIVTTTMQGCRDVVRDGWNGYLVPPRTPDLLARRILGLLEQPQAARAMAGRASDLVRRDFNLDITVDRYAAVYEDILRC